jgi:hypothetical protein
MNRNAKKAEKTIECHTIATFEGHVFYNFGPYDLATISIRSPRTGVTLVAKASDLPSAFVAKVQAYMFAIAEGVLEHDAAGSYDTDDCGDRQAAYDSISDLIVAYTTDELRAFAAVARQPWKPAYARRAS